jgi:hypothetical protein
MKNNPDSDWVAEAKARKEDMSGIEQDIDSITGEQLQALYDSGTSSSELINIRKRMIGLTNYFVARCLEKEDAIEGATNWLSQATPIVEVNNRNTRIPVDVNGDVLYPKEDVSDALNRLYDELDASNVGVYVSEPTKEGFRARYESETLKDEAFFRWDAPSKSYILTDSISGDLVDRENKVLKFQIDDLMRYKLSSEGEVVDLSPNMKQQIRDLLDERMSPRRSSESLISLIRNKIGDYKNPIPDPLDTSLQIKNPPEVPNIPDAIDLDQDILDPSKMWFYGMTSE